MRQTSEKVSRSRLDTLKIFLNSKRDYYKTFLMNKK
nr:MAG TPA: hypothetical protein [Caudoviricetes sp.]